MMEECRSLFGDGQDTGHEGLSKSRFSRRNRSGLGHGGFGKWGRKGEDRKRKDGTKEAGRKYVGRLKRRGRYEGGFCLLPAGADAEDKNRSD